jgi:two-component system, chemotaxis family, chemotaxis protein CheY
MGVATVLVVDDDEDIRDLIQLELEDGGYRVLTAPDGQVALDLLGRSRIDLILLDMRMPVMDGWTFARQYRQWSIPHAPIVVITAAKDASQRAAEIAADDHLSKPFELKDLDAVVQRALHH